MSSTCFPWRASENADTVERLAIERATGHAPRGVHVVEGPEQVGRPHLGVDRIRIHELESAGRDAAEALGRAADALRDSLAEQESR